MIQTMTLTKRQASALAKLVVKHPEMQHFHLSKSSGAATIRVELMFPTAYNIEADGEIIDVGL